MAKRLILVEIDVAPSDPKRCGAYCHPLYAMNDPERHFCWSFHETCLGGIRCLQCLEAETAAHSALKGGAK